MAVAWIARVFVALIGVVLIIVGVVTKSPREAAFIVSGAFIIAFVIYAIIRQLASGLALEVESGGGDTKVQLVGLFQLDTPWDWIAAVITIAGFIVPWFIWK